MNILVTGGAGYIGSHAVKMLIDKGYNVSVIDNLSTGHLDAVDKRANFNNIDIRNKNFVVDVLKNNKIDAVIHFAALSLVGESMKIPLEYYDNNVYGTKVLLDAMNEASVKKIVFSSTAAVYGDKDVSNITEDTLENPTNAYGETKLSIEKMLKWADIAHGIKYIALRYFNVAGAFHTGEIGERHRVETHLIPLVLQVPLNKRDSIGIYGNDYNTPDGTCIRDYIHVEDLVEAHILAIEKLGKESVSNYYNLGGGVGYSVLDIIEASRKATKHEIPSIVTPRRAGDPAILVASSEKAERELKWIKKYNNIEDIIQSAWKFHKSYKEDSNNENK